MRCVVSRSGTSFPWFSFFFGDLLWEGLLDYWHLTSVYCSHKLPVVKQVFSLYTYIEFQLLEKYDGDRLFFFTSVGLMYQKMFYPVSFCILLFSAYSAASVSPGDSETWPLAIREDRNPIWGAAETQGRQDAVWDLPWGLRQHPGEQGLEV